MSILHLLTPRVIELGKIKIGAKEEKERTSAAGGKWRAPIKLDHFIVTTMQRDGRGDLVPDDGLMAGLLAKHGSADKHLREIPIALLSDSVEDVLLTNFCVYRGKVLGGRCDGKVFTRYTDTAGAPLAEPVAVDCDGKHHLVKPWKPHGTFCCVIASGDAKWGGVYKFRTTSIISIEQLYSSLLHIQNLTGGILQGLPLRLVVRPVQVAPEGRATTVYVVHVELRGPDLAQIQETARRLAEGRLANRRAVIETQAAYRAMLTAPGESETEEESAEVAEEFAPPEDVQTPSPRTRRKNTAEPPPAEAPRVPEVVPPPAHDAETGEVPPPAEWIESIAKVSGEKQIAKVAAGMTGAARSGDLSHVDLPAVFAALLARCTTRAECQNAAGVVTALRDEVPAPLFDALHAAYKARQAEVAK